VSEWERARQELRGVKPPPAAKPAAPAAATKTPALADTILKLLAENGHNFRQLGDDERLIVAVTFRGSAGGRARTASGQSTMSDPSAAPANTNTGGSSAGPRPPASANDLELLGDLHLKNGRYDEAVETFRKAAAAQTDPQRLAQLHTKIALVYQTKAIGDPKQRDDAVARGLDYLKRQQGDDYQRYAQALLALAYARNLDPAAAGEAQASAQPVPLPARLIISAKKRDLAAVAAGRMTFEQFRQAASVEYQEFDPPAAEKPAEKK
jgi:tetratricopeptide (TPR) repeat protein